MAAEFKVPESIPQDLLLIQEIVGAAQAPEECEVKSSSSSSSSESSSDDDISSSGSEVEAEDSEDEIEAKLVAAGDDSEPASAKSASEPDNSSSDSSSESESEHVAKKGETVALDEGPDDDDEDAVPAVSGGSLFQTKHEITETEINIPDADEVGPEETLEKVGEIVNIVDQIAIVRSLPSENMNRGSQKALDSDTLLFFDDRKVMGYIYETFGPTSQPLYQVKYNSKYPLNTERVRVSREVFTVPTKSKFVFVEQIKAIKGSDASNVYDEEPADDELEFSDDEAEAAYKSRLKRKRGESRSRSVPHSRGVTPNPSHMRDEELVDDSVLSGNAYDEVGPYDLDFSKPGPSRPMPVPYDDPYSTAYEQPNNETLLPHPPSRSQSQVRDLRPEARPRGRGRGAHRGRGQARGHGGRDAGGPHNRGSWSSSYSNSLAEPYDPRTPSQPMGSSYYEQDQGWDYSAPAPVPTQQQQHYPFTPPGFSQAHQAMSFVQPHINPRFAPLLGMPFSAPQNSMNFGMHQLSSHGAYDTGAHIGGNPLHSMGFQGQQWNAQWSAPGGQQSYKEDDRH